MAQRERAPAATLSAVCPTEPPTGSPRKNPEAMLPAPCARKSRFTLDGSPPGLGADSRTPAPWTRTIAATAAAPDTSPNDSAPRSGSAGAGIPEGIGLASETRATVSSPSAHSTSAGITSASSAPIVASPNRLASASKAIAPRPVNVAASSIRPGCVTTSRALASAKGPSASAPTRSGSWPSTMFAATPVRKPIITECATKRV